MTRFMDLTNKKQIETQLEQSAVRLKALANALPDLIWFKDPQGIYISCNTRFEQFFGADEVQIVGKTDYDFVAINMADTFRENDQKVMKSGESGKNQEWIKFANDGHSELLQTTKIPIFNAEHSLMGVLGIGHDITEITAVHDELRGNALFLNTLLEAMPVAVFYKDLGGRYTGVNSAFEKLTGYSRSELLGKTVYDISPREFADIYHTKDMELLKKTGFQVYETKVHSVKGMVHDVVYHKATFTDSVGQVAGLIGVVLDVTALRKEEDELHEAKDQAEQANRIKSEFLSNMSHELRTPLNAIIGFSEALKDGLMGKVAENQLEYINDIYISGEHLLSLINDILDLAKVEAGKLELELEQFSLDSVLQNSLSMVKEKALTHRLKVTLEADTMMPEIVADIRKLKQIVYNMLSNAVKFTPDGGDVTIGAHRVGDMLEITVRDTGIGISTENQAKLFQPFTQIDSILARKYQGTGLGLVMIKHLAELHGGSVSFASEVNKGSLFSVKIPWREAVE